MQRKGHKIQKRKLPKCYQNEMNQTLDSKKSITFHCTMPKTLKLVYIFPDQTHQKTQEEGHLPWRT